MYNENVLDLVHILGFEALQLFKDRYLMEKTFETFVSLVKRYEIVNRICINDLDSHKIAEFDMFPGDDG